MKRVLAALALGVAVVSTPAAADDFAATWSVAARGMTAGEFTLAMTTDGAKYSATAQRRMTGFARQLVGSKQDYTYSANGLVASSGALKPVAYQHQGGKNNRLIEVKFAADDVVSTQTKLAAVPATRDQKLGSLDFVSAFVTMITPPKAGDPCKRTIKVFDGRAVFSLAFSPNGHQAANVAGFKGQAIRCKVAYTPIAGFRDPQEPATLTFLFAPAQNGVYRPLRIEMPTDDVGVVTLEAKSFKLTPAA